MKAAFLGLVLLLAARPAPSPAAGFILAGESILFPGDLRRPQFTALQLSKSAEATRAGFVRWARTLEGQAIIRRFRLGDCAVIVREDREEPSIGRAPQPGFMTLLAAHDRSVYKEYELILNPAIAAGYVNSTSIDLGLPRSATDAMAVAWAAEMLHIDFYADGVPLPHHERADFQERWLAVAEQLGLPNTEHGDEGERAEMRENAASRH